MDSFYRRPKEKPKAQAVSAPSTERQMRAYRRVASVSVTNHSKVLHRLSAKLRQIADNPSSNRYRNFYALYYVLGDVMQEGRVAAE